MLLEFGANATRQDGAGQMPLLEAVREDQADIASVLVHAAPPDSIGTQDAQFRLAILFFLNKAVL